MEVTQGAPFESFGLSEATMRAIRNKHYTVSTQGKPACDKIHYLPVAPMFAEAINRIYEEMSISSLFE